VRNNIEGDGRRKTEDGRWEMEDGRWKRGEMRGEKVRLTVTVTATAFGLQTSIKMVAGPSI
jgi:hypothetical protein